MSVKVLDIDGDQFTLGLNWHTAEGPGVKKDISSFVKSEGYSYGVSLTATVEEPLARNAIDQITGVKKDQVWQVGASDDEDVEKTTSMAFLLAKMTGHSGIFCMTVNEDHKWVLAVSEGQVVVTTDIVLPDESARELVVELAEALAGTHTEETPVIYILDDEAFADCFEDHDEDFTDVVTSFKEVFLSGLLVGDYDAIFKKATIKSLDSKDGLKLILAIAVIGGGYYGYTAYQDNKLAQERLKRQAARMIEKKEPQGPSDEEILANALEEERTWLRNEFNDTSNLRFVSSAIAQYRKAPSIINGWRPDVFSAKDTGASIKWISERGTTLGFKQFAEGFSNSYNFDARGEMVTTSHSLDTSGMDKPVNPEELIKNEKSRLWLLHELQVRNLDWKMSEPSVPDRPRDIQGLRDTTKSSVRQLQYKTSDLIISGRSVDDIRALYDLINEGNRIKIKSMSIDYKNQNWEIKGLYYEE